MFGFTPFAQSAFSDNGVVDVSVSITGVLAPGEVGFVSARNVNRVFPTGVDATASVGSIDSVTGTAVVSPTGVAATGEIGSPSISGDSTLSLVGVAGTGVVGTAAVSADSNVTVTGVSATGSVGTAEAEAGAIVPTTGLEATSAVGSVTVNEGQGIDVSVTGVSATSAVGSIASVTGTARVFPTGVEGSGEVQAVLVWGKIVPDPGTTWTEIAA